MKTKKILVGSIFIVGLLLLVTSASAIEYKTINDDIKVRVQEMKARVLEKFQAADYEKLENLILAGGIAALVFYIFKSLNDIRRGEGIIVNIKDIVKGGGSIIVITVLIIEFLKELQVYSPPPP
jgi:hypothetical protein